MNLIIGTAQFGLDYGINNNIGKPKIENVHKILDVAYENEIRILDISISNVSILGFSFLSGSQR